MQQHSAGRGETLLPNSSGRQQLRRASADGLLAPARMGSHRWTHPLRVRSVLALPAAFLLIEPGRSEPRGRFRQGARSLSARACLPLTPFLECPRSTPND